MKIGSEEDLSGQDLRGRNLSGADLSEANLSFAALSKANLSKADLSFANLSFADLGEANLSNANLSGAYLGEANLSGADLSGADLSKANLWYANLSAANLSGADLSAAYLRGTDLSGADLSNANLRKANLSDANLSKAGLSGANLSKAKLSHVDLSGANVEHVVGVDVWGDSCPKQETFSRALARAGATALGCWWHFGQGENHTLMRVWHCGAETVADAIAHPAPEGRHLAVEVVISYNLMADTLAHHAYGWYIEDGELVRRPIEAANTAAHNLTTIAALRDAGGPGLSVRMTQIKSIARGLAMRTCSWRDDVQERRGNLGPVEIYTDLGSHPVIVLKSRVVPLRRRRAAGR